jgi:hypothetical protein
LGNQCGLFFLPHGLFLKPLAFCLPIRPDQASLDLLIQGLLNGTLHLQSRAALPGLPPAI